jgi:hypothetical protein
MRRITETGKCCRRYPLQTNGNSHQSNLLKHQSRGNAPTAAATEEGHGERIEEEETIPIAVAAADGHDNLLMAETIDGQIKRAKLNYFNSQV